MRFTSLEAAIVQALVEKNAPAFTRRLLAMLAFGVPVGVLNAAISYVQEALAQRFRASLTAHARRKYMANLVFYKVENLDARMRQADQVLVSDVALFSSSLAELWSSLAKPSLDLLLFNAQLSANVGARGFFFATAAIHLGTFLLQLVAPSFGSLVAEEQALEGEYRAACGRVITYGEEIAFCDGAAKEESLLRRAYDALAAHSAVVS